MPLEHRSISIGKSVSSTEYMFCPYMHACMLPHHAAPLPMMYLTQIMCVQASASIDRGAVSVEAQLKMQLADSIFDDLIGDTASKLLDLDLL